MNSYFRPPSIFDIDFSTPKRFRGVQEYECRGPPVPEFDFSIEDFLEEDSDDGEELLNYKPEEPALRYREDFDSEVSCQYFMRAWCMTWARRKKVKLLLYN